MIIVILIWLHSKRGRPSCLGAAALTYPPLFIFCANSSFLRQELCVPFAAPPQEYHTSCVSHQSHELPSISRDHSMTMTTTAARKLLAARLMLERKGTHGNPEHPTDLRLCRHDHHKLIYFEAQIEFICSITDETRSLLYCLKVLHRVSVILLLSLEQLHVSVCMVSCGDYTTPLTPLFSNDSSIPSLVNGRPSMNCTVLKIRSAKKKKDRVKKIVR